MKPITSILLVAAIICYCFLPLFHITLVEGSVSGLSYTSAMFSRHSIYALLPFISAFFAIVFNSLRNRYWGVLVVLFISLGLYFFATVGSIKEFALVHDPAAVSDTELTQGIPLSGLGVGYTTSVVLLAVALVSAIVSMLPFKFNELIEQSIDSKLEESRRHLSQFSRHERASKAATAHGAPAEAAPQEVKPDVDRSAYMPSEANADVDHSAYMPPEAKTDSDHSAYMPSEAKPESDHSAYMPHDNSGDER